MNRRNNDTPPTQRAFNTGGKTYEMTVFYNLALNRMLRIIHYQREKKNEFDDEKLDEYLETYLNHCKKSNGEAPPKEIDFGDEVYSKLRNYMWKGYEMEKNKSGYSVTEEDKRIIRKLLYKLRDIRNFQSHIWHSNNVLEFDKELSDFITLKHDFVLDTLSKENPTEVAFYKKNYKDQPLFDTRRHAINITGNYILL